MCNGVNLQNSSDCTAMWGFQHHCLCNKVCLNEMGLSYTVLTNLKEERVNGGSRIICPGQQKILPPACVHLSYHRKGSHREALLGRNVFLFLTLQWEDVSDVALGALAFCVPGCFKKMSLTAGEGTWSKPTALKIQDTTSHLWKDVFRKQQYIF